MDLLFMAHSARLALSWFIPGEPVTPPVPCFSAPFSSVDRGSPGAFLYQLWHEQALLLYEPDSPVLLRTPLLVTELMPLVPAQPNHLPEHPDQFKLIRDTSYWPINTMYMMALLSPLIIRFSSHFCKSHTSLTWLCSQPLLALAYIEVSKLNDFVFKIDP